MDIGKSSTPTLSYLTTGGPRLRSEADFNDALETVSRQRIVRKAGEIIRYNINSPHPIVPKSAALGGIGHRKKKESGKHRNPAMDPVPQGQAYAQTSWDLYPFIPARN